MHLEGEMIVNKILQTVISLFDGVDDDSQFLKFNY